MTFYEGERVTLHLGDCIEVMRTLPAASVDAVVTDPPYELGFMGKSWDASGVAYSIEMWREVLRVLKPGGHLAAFSAPRTYHRMACAIEDAGFEVRDSLLWMFGSGFPKSLDVSKAIDKAAGAEREIVGSRVTGAAMQSRAHGRGASDAGSGQNVITVTTPATDAARQWDGWGTALKPAYEPIVLARKPLAGTVAANVLAHGTGAINVDGCRIGTETVRTSPRRSDVHEDGRTIGSHWSGDVDTSDREGRWPANVLLDDEAAALLDAQTGERPAGGSLSGNEPSRPFDVAYGEMKGRREWSSYGDGGGASRFFYTAKTSRAEREAGLDLIEPARRADAATRDADAPGSNNPRLRVGGRRNDHPTVKPVDLMRWLCRLVTPPGGVILDPFLGSGTTAMAALDEGFSCIGIERDPRYIAIAQHRITHRHLLEVATVEPTAASPNGRLL